MKDMVRGVAGAGLLAPLAWAAIGCGAGQGSPTSAPSSGPAAASTSASVPITPSPTAPAPGTPVRGAGQGTPGGVSSSTSSPTVPPTPASATGTPAVGAPATPSPPATASGTPGGGAGQVVGTVVRFSAGSTSVEVTIGQDNPAVRDFLAMLPLTLTLEELAGKEKIAYLPRRLAHGGSPGSDPEDGDLIYYIPWGNLGFYYDAAGIGYSDQTIHLGTYNASREQLAQLEGQPVTVEVARR